jgi:hypothetical protein
MRVREDGRRKRYPRLRQPGGMGLYVEHTTFDIAGGRDYIKSTWVHLDGASVTVTDLGSRRAERPGFFLFQVIDRPIKMLVSRYGKS